MKLTRQLSFLTLGILFLSSLFPISYGNAFKGLSPNVHTLLENNAFIYDINNASGDVYFYPAGFVRLETNGQINLTYTGIYEEYGNLDYFFDIQIILANGQVNTTISNISQSTIGMTFIWGFGGFTPNFVCSADWNSLDELAQSIAEAPAGDPWPHLNGDLEILSESGMHIYDFSQNPANGTQQTYLQYRASTGILQAFKSSFGDYYLEADLISPHFYASEQIHSLETNPISFQILESSGSVYFYPVGNVALEENGHINLTYVGEYFEYGMLDLFFDISFIYADGSINTTITNISQSSIGMTLIWGFGGFSPNLVPLYEWSMLDEHAYSVSNSPVEAGWPGLNGTLSISDTQKNHTFNYDQNPLIGNQSTFLVYDKETTLLTTFNSSFANYHLYASRILENTPDDQQIDMDIPGFPLLGVFGLFSIVVLFLKTKRWIK